MSFAVAVPRSTSVSVPVAPTVTSAGGVTTGGVVSTTVIDMAETLLVSSLSATTSPASPSTRTYHRPADVPDGMEICSVEKRMFPGLNVATLRDVSLDPICVSEASSVTSADR